MKTVLIFVMTSAGVPYPELMEVSERTWANGAMGGVETLFYSNEERPAAENLIRVPAGGSIYDMGRKNLLAYKWALENRQWDFMARVNASCYVSRKRLVEWVQTQPTTGLFQGCQAALGGGNIYLWGGGQYLISRDVVQAMVDNGDKWDHSLMEDMAMSKLVLELGLALNVNCRSCTVNKRPNDWLCIDYINGGQAGFEFSDFKEFAEKNSCHFIRVKQDSDRTQDVRIMQELYKYGV